MFQGVDLLEWFHFTIQVMPMKFSFAFLCLQVAAVVALVMKLLHIMLRYLINHEYIWV